MKNLFAGAFSLLLCFFFIVSCEQSKKYTLTVELPEEYEGDTIFYHTRPSEDPLDTAIVKNGIAVFTGMASDTLSDIGFIRYNPQRSAELFAIENGNINLNLKDPDKTILSGTSINEDYQRFKTSLDSLFTISRERYLAQQKEIEENELAPKRNAELEKELDEFIAKFEDLIISYSGKYADSDLGEYILLDNYINFKNVDKLEKAITLFRPVSQESEKIVPLKNYVAIAKKTAVGSLFMDVTGFDLDGNARSLSDYVGKGKPVFLDFWASWCGPCRRALPEVRQIYKDYKDKGFEIVGISLDSNKENWATATKDEEITWPQFSNLQGWSDPAAETYGIRFIPFTILFDREGKVAGKNLSDATLRLKLEELLKQ